MPGMRVAKKFRTECILEQLEARRLLAAQPLITEVMAKNVQTVEDGNGVSSDWIEIYNAGDATADLTGWHITDDPERLRKWTFPAIQLGPQQFLIVFASGEGRPDHRGQLHTNFRLSASGEFLALVESTGTVSQQLAFPTQYEDISYGLDMPEAITKGYFAQPTPGADNSVVFESVTTDTVMMSRASGTFTHQITVALSASEPRQPIVYTLDGTLPHAGSSQYSGPLLIDASTQMRARVVQPNRVPGPVATASYLRLAADVVDFAAELPIMVIDNYGAGAFPNTGWNQTNSGIHQLPRQPASLMLFEPSAGAARWTETADQSSRIGIRVRGAFSSTFREPGLSVETWRAGADVDQDVALAGIAEDSDWILYAPNPSHDETLIDNTFMFDISNQLGQWAPEVRYVETFVNTDGGDITMADHVGLYVITEKVKRSAERLSFDELSPDGTSGGWLLDVNRMDSIALDGTLPRNFHTAGRDGVLQTDGDLFNSSSRGDDIPRQYNAYINFDDPNGFSINPVQRRAIEDWFAEMEAVLFGRAAGITWNDPIDGYAKYLDVQSFIDYFILNDISHNGDGLLLSMWLYNPDPARGGKLKFGPIWDVDLGSFSGPPTSELMRRTTQLWYGRLFDDPNFVLQYRDRWQELRRTVLSDQNMNQTIDRWFASIGETAATRDGVRGWPNRLQRMKDWLSQRAAAIDRLFPAPVTFNRDGGAVPSGFELSAQVERGTIYYTTDGSDPRNPDGTVSPRAQVVETQLTPILTAPAAASVIIPDQTVDRQIGSAWTGAEFVEGAAGESWISGPTGVGYDRGNAYDPLIETDLGDVDRSVYIRIRFELTEDSLATIESLLLKIQYDDGFVAYVNGHEIARSNASGAVGEPLAFDARASASHTASSAEFDEFPVDGVEFLRAGANVLAIQGLNRSTGSSDLVMRPELHDLKVVSPPIVITEPVTIAARALAGREWSGIHRAEFTISPPGDLNADGKLDVADIDYLCGELRSPDSALDLNGDGRLDRGDLELLVRDHLGTSLGDANLDGVFDTNDLVEIFQAGEFEDRVEGNSTWADGDWDCDREFTTGDLVAAFRSGDFAVAARAHQAAFNPTLLTATLIEFNQRRANRADRLATAPELGVNTQAVFGQPREMTTPHVRSEARDDRTLVTERKESAKPLELEWPFEESI